VAASSLFARIFALLLLTVLLAQAVAVAAILLASPAPPAAMTLGEVADSITRARGALVAEGARPGPPAAARRVAPAARLAARELAARLGLSPDSVVVELAPEQRNRRVELVPPEAPHRLEAALVGDFRVHLRGEGGFWTAYRPARRPLGSWEAELVGLFLFGGLLILPVAWWFARLLARPFADLAAEAERIGRNPAAVPAEIPGPLEARAVGRALAAMQERIAGHIRERTQMLAAIAHDMRTPLTRLAFRAEALPEPARSAAASDIAEMEAMLSSVVAFGRETGSADRRERLELGSLIEQVLDGLASPPPCLVTSGPVIVEGDPVALRRLVANLVCNALVHGKAPEVRLAAEGGTALLEVRDSGPGMAEADLARAFEPFFRAGAPGTGSGLGLAAVRAIARAHGGEATLANRPEGGLSARVRLPLAPGPD